MGNDLAKVPAANAPVAVQPERMNADPFWGTVSKHKFAEFNICTVSRDENGNQRVKVDSSQPTIRAFLTDGDKTMESQWQTPFENSNPELKMPMLRRLKKCIRLIPKVLNWNIYFGIVLTTNDNGSAWMNKIRSIK